MQGLRLAHETQSQEELALIQELLQGPGLGLGLTDGDTSTGEALTGDPSCSGDWPAASDGMTGSARRSSGGSNIESAGEFSGVGSGSCSPRSRSGSCVDADVGAGGKVSFAEMAKVCFLKYRKQVPMDFAFDAILNIFECVRFCFDALIYFLLLLSFTRWWAATTRHYRIPA